MKFFRNRWFRTWVGVLCFQPFVSAICDTTRAEDDVTGPPACKGCSSIDGDWTVIASGHEGALIGKAPEHFQQMLDDIQRSFSISDKKYHDTVDHFRRGRQISVTPGVFECDDETDPKRFWILKGEGLQYSRRIAYKGIWKIEGDLLILYRTMKSSMPFPSAFPDLGKRIPANHAVFVLQRIPADVAE